MVIYMYGGKFCSSTVNHSIVSSIPVKCPNASILERKLDWSVSSMSRKGQIHKPLINRLALQEA